MRGNDFNDVYCLFACFLFLFPIFASVYGAAFRTSMWFLHWLPIGGVSILACS